MNPFKSSGLKAHRSPSYGVGGCLKVCHVPLIVSTGLYLMHQLEHTQWATCACSQMSRARVTRPSQRAHTLAGTGASQCRFPHFDPTQSQIIRTCFQIGTYGRRLPEIKPPRRVSFNNLTANRALSIDIFWGGGSVALFNVLFFHNKLSPASICFVTILQPGSAANTALAFSNVG